MAGITLTMWKESATRARECTAYPTMSSRKKKAVSMPRRIMIRVDLESPMLTASERKQRSLRRFQRSFRLDFNLAAVNSCSSHARGRRRLRRVVAQRLPRVLKGACCVVRKKMICHRYPQLKRDTGRTDAGGVSALLHGVSAHPNPNSNSSDRA